MNAEFIRCLAKVLLSCSLTIPLFPLYAALGKSLKWFTSLPNFLVKYRYIWTSMFLFEYFLTFFRSFTNIGRLKVAWDMTPRQVRSTNFKKSKKEKNPPKMENEEKMPNTGKRTNPSDPTIPSWKHGVFTAIHSFLATHDLDNFNKLFASESFEEALGTIIPCHACKSDNDAQTHKVTVLTWSLSTFFSVFLYYSLLDFSYLYLRIKIFIHGGVRPTFVCYSWIMFYWALGLFCFG